jgi:periplasmic divalent cation tolerance protein
MNRDQELLLLVKSRRGALEGIKQAVADLHPYQLPEIIALEVTGGLKRYLDWVVSETGEAQGGAAPQTTQQPIINHEEKK